MKLKTSNIRSAMGEFPLLWFLFFLAVMCLQIYLMGLAETRPPNQKELLYQSLYHPLLTPFFILITFGLLLEFIGARLPVLNQIGGRFLLPVLLPSVLVYYNFFPPTLLARLKYSFFLRPPNTAHNYGLGINFAQFFIAIVIMGSILEIERSFFKRNLLKFMPLTLVTLSSSALMVGSLGYLLGYQSPFSHYSKGAFLDSFFYVFVPLTSGGTNIGVIGLSQGIYHQKTLMSSDEIRSVLLAPLVCARILSYFLVGVLYRLFDHQKKYSGQGALELKALSASPTKTPPPPSNYQDIGKGLLIAFVLFNASSVLNTGFFYLWQLQTENMTYILLFLLIIKISGFLPAKYQNYVVQAGKFMAVNFTGLALVAVGLTTDFKRFLDCLQNLPLLLMVIAALMTALIVSFSLAKYFGFYNFESALTVGLGSHNVATIGVMNISKRLHLLAFVQIITRVIGSLVYLWVIWVF